MRETDSRRRTVDFLEPLLARNPSGSEWLPPLLQAAPHADRLGELAAAPASLHANLTVPGLEGRRTCFMYPVAPPPALIAWYIENPDRLSWPEDVELSTETRVLRRALLYDEPAGSRARAQERARALAPVRSAFAEEWWRFEETFRPDCLLMTDRLVLAIVAADAPLPPASPWYPQRSVLVRGLEAAWRLAGARGWGTMLLSRRAVPEAADSALRAALPDAAPHLGPEDREALASGYLGNLTWEDAADQVGFFGSSG